MREVQVPVELDDYEGMYVEVIVTARVYPGEPMVRYYPDGSGYPGSPPEAELFGMDVVKALDENDVQVEVDESLDAAIEDYLYNNPDLWYEEAIENAQEPFDY